MAETFKGFGLETITALFGALGADAVKDGIKKILDAATEAGKDAIKTYPVSAKDRARVWNFILTGLAKIDPQVTQTLRERQEKRQKCLPPYKPGDENKLNIALAEIDRAFKEPEFKPIPPKTRWERPDEFRVRLEKEGEIREKIMADFNATRAAPLIALTSLNDDQFDAVIEAIIDDGLLQLARRVGVETKSLGTTALQKTERGLGKTIDVLLGGVEEVLDIEEVQ